MCTEYSLLGGGGGVRFRGDLHWYTAGPGVFFFSSRWLLGFCSCFFLCFSRDIFFFQSLFCFLSVHYCLCFISVLVLVLFLHIFTSCVAFSHSEDRKHAVYWWSRHTSVIALPRQPQPWALCSRAVTRSSHRHGTFRPGSPDHFQSPTTSYPFTPPPPSSPTNHHPTATTTMPISPWFQKSLTLRPRSRGSYLITSEIEAGVPEISRYRVGLLTLFIQHTSCALSVNESYDADVRSDMSDAMDRIVVEDKNGAAGLYRHDAEGSDDMPVGFFALFFPSFFRLGGEEG